MSTMTYHTYQDVNLDPCFEEYKAALLPLVFDEEDFSENAYASHHYAAKIAEVSLK